MFCLKAEDGLLKENLFPFKPDEPSLEPEDFGMDGEELALKGES